MSQICTKGLNMVITIFHTESGSTEEWLQVNDDCTVTHHVEASGWSMRGGLRPREEIMSADEAKAKWASFANEIERAIEKIAGRK